MNCLTCFPEYIETIVEYEQPANAIDLLFGKKNQLQSWIWEFYIEGCMKITK